MGLGLSLAIIIGFGGASGGDELPAIPDSPAAALSLEQIEPELPTFDPNLWGASPGDYSASGSPGDGTAPSPEQVFGTLALMMALVFAIAPRRERIEEAVSSVRSHLQDSLFSDVTHGDLASIQETLGGLWPRERELAIRGLSEREVSVWMRELDGFNGSFSEKEEARLFARLVPGMSSLSLSRFMAAGKGEEVVEALKLHGSSRQRVALAVALAGQLGGPSRGRRLIATLVDVSDPAVLEAEVSGWLAAGVMTLKLDQFFGVGGDLEPEAEVGYRLDAAAALARSGAEFTDPAVKAALFVELARRITDSEGRRWEGSASEALAGTTLLLRSDTAAVIRQLNHGVDPHGNTMADWVEEMIDEDRVDELDAILSELMGRDRLTHFSDPGVNPAQPYPNASNLGYFVGSYQLAIEQIAHSAEGKIELVGLLFAILTGVIPGPKGGNLSLPLGPLVDLHAREVLDGFQGKAAGVKQTLWGLAKPRTEDGLLWNGPGTTQFQDAWEEVVEVR